MRPSLACCWAVAARRRDSSKWLTGLELFGLKKTRCRLMLPPEDQHGWKDCDKVTVSTVPHTKSLRGLEGLLTDSVSLPASPWLPQPSGLLSTLVPLGAKAPAPCQPPIDGQEERLPSNLLRKEGGNAPHSSPSHLSLYSSCHFLINHVPRATNGAVPGCGAEDSEMKPQARAAYNAPIEGERQTRGARDPRRHISFPEARSPCHRRTRAGLR